MMGCKCTKQGVSQGTLLGKLRNAFTAASHKGASVGDEGGTRMALGVDEDLLRQKIASARLPASGSQ